jgi:uncharacterized membrane protein YeaQ/YmgE (transglycosylase-associated protein family)
VTIIGYIIVGCIVGPIARLLVPGEDPMPWWGTILLGAGGAFLGGFITDILPGDNRGIPWIASIIGAVLLVLAARVVGGRRTS